VGLRRRPTTIEVVIETIFLSHRWAGSICQIGTLTPASFRRAFSWSHSGIVACMLYSVLPAVTKIYHLCQKVIIVLLHLETEEFRRQSFVPCVEDSPHPSGVRSGPSGPHGKRQLLLATLAFVELRSERPPASRRAKPTELDGGVVSDAKTSTDRPRTLGHLRCGRKFGLEVWSRDTRGALHYSPHWTKVILLPR